MWCVALNQPARDFWESTPRRVGTFFAAYARHNDTVDYRFGLIAAVIGNVNRGKRSRMLHPSDFFPRLTKHSRITDHAVMRDTFLSIARAAQHQRGAK